MLAFAAACSGPQPQPAPPERSGKGFYHELGPGETIWHVAQRYGVAVEDILRANRIDDPHRLPRGLRIFVPGVDPQPEDAGSARARELPLVRGCSLTYQLKSERQQLAREEAGVSFQWPLRGRITTCFAPENGRAHDGIDIAVPEGSEVRAAESGTVIYSAPLGAYGNLIVLRHPGPYTSLYAHNDRNLREAGEFVEKGEPIAESGRSGNATGPHLHFEIRRARRPDNPMLYLP
jgi:murein DD-endopeptidase MepM/ murein hydrolase activator NlpD